MTSKKKRTAGKGSAVPPESPLVPNRTMQRMYAGMVESRLLEELIRKRDRKMARPTVHGHEACRVGAVLGLLPEDYTSDLPGTVTTAFLRGEPPAKLLDVASPIKLDTTGLLPSDCKSHVRLHQAVGVAIALKRQKSASVVVVFVEAGEPKAAWRDVLQSAAALELPMLFVVLPAEKQAKFGDLSARATLAGVPGIPVDASDAIALYRVAQESIGRARAGGGPALMECVPFVMSSKKKSSKKTALPDPVLAMKASLLRRTICGQDWLASVPAAFRVRLKAL